jgi:HAD superfamily hydrolase (TIGR01509 family)
MNKPVIKAILFDLDDTLWDIRPVLARAEAHLYAWLSQHTPIISDLYSIETLRAHRLNLLKEHPHLQVNLFALRHFALTQLFQAHGYATDLVDEAMAVFAKARNEVHLFDDVLPGFQQLHAKWVLGSVTNGTTDLSTTPLAPYFKTSIASFQFGACKPEPAIFLAACDAIQIPPTEVVYVGDDPVFDIFGAQQVGMQAVWMNRFQRDYAGDNIPDAQCRDLYELHQWMQTHTQSTQP